MRQTTPDTQIRQRPNTMNDIADLREEYTRGGLSEEEASDDPITQFERWFEAAREADPEHANAMTLATASPEDGQPSARIVLLKDYDERGFVFYTNYRSRKARELTANTQAALVFWWAELERQVRVEGAVERIADAESDAYFARRPRESQIGAWASPQSKSIGTRAELERKRAAIRTKYEGRDVPRPPHWGGFRVRPEAVEFWQGRSGRLHDRLRYHRFEGAWHLNRLAP
jgi:pyridoxamine 5'-phosphate oxidase